MVGWASLDPIQVSRPPWSLCTATLFPRHELPQFIDITFQAQHKNRCLPSQYTL